MRFKDRIKSYGFWTALSGAVVILVQSITKCFGVEVQEELISDIIMSVCGVLVVFGIVTMPNKKETEENTEETEINQENSEEKDKENIVEIEDKKD